VQRYLTLIQDPAIASTITRLLQKPGQQNHPERYAFDCFNTIRIAKLDQRIDQLRKEMKSGEKPKDEVLQQYRELIEERKHLEQINFAFE